MPFSRRLFFALPAGALVSFGLFVTTGKALYRPAPAELVWVLAGFIPWLAASAPLALVFAGLRENNYVRVSSALLALFLAPLAFELPWAGLPAMAGAGLFFWFRPVRGGWPRAFAALCSLGAGLYLLFHVKQALWG